LQVQIDKLVDDIMNLTVGDWPSVYDHKNRLRRMNMTVDVRNLILEALQNANTDKEENRSVVVESV
jgi:hypothetical protein